MKIHSYLNFDGRCAEAFRFYAGCFGGRIVGIQTFGESPMADNVAPEWRSKVIHAKLDVGDQTLLGSDAPPDRYNKPQGFFVSLSVAKPEEAERIFKALAEGGTVEMPIQQTFWAARFGMLVDRFGIPWMVNCEPAA